MLSDQNNFIPQWHILDPFKRKQGQRRPLRLWASPEGGALPWNETKVDLRPQLTLRSQSAGLKVSEMCLVPGLHGSQPQGQDQHWRSHAT